eukprot:SAG22_NODE_1143_length_5376_cov_7.459731_3_plen_160_part_00
MAAVASTSKGASAAAAPALADVVAAAPPLLLLRACAGSSRGLFSARPSAPAAARPVQVPRRSPGGDAFCSGPSGLSGVRLSVLSSWDMAMAAACPRPACGCGLELSWNLKICSHLILTEVHTALYAYTRPPWHTENSCLPAWEAPELLLRHYVEGCDSG